MICDISACPKPLNQKLVYQHSSKVYEIQQLSEAGEADNGKVHSYACITDEDIGNDVNLARMRGRLSCVVRSTWEMHVVLHQLKDSPKWIH